jgi:hypothetical protein
MVASLPSDAISSGSRGTRTHNSPVANTCFRDRPLILPDDFLVLRVSKSCVCELRGLESNQRPPDSESGVTTSSNCPAFQWDYRLRPSSSLIARRPSLLYQQQLPRSVFISLENDAPNKVRGEGLEPSSPASKAGSLPLADPRASLLSALRELNPPRRLGRLEPLPLGQGHTFPMRKPWDSNPQTSCARRLFSRQVPHPAGWLPSIDTQSNAAYASAAAAGIEPASGRLTAACPYQHGPHRISLQRSNTSSSRLIRLRRTCPYQHWPHRNESPKS